MKLNKTIDSPRRVKNSLNVHTFPKDYERVDSRSSTVPDQTMSIKEILLRHSRGLPITAGKVPIYEASDDTPISDFPDLSGLDRADRMQAVHDHAQEYEQLKQHVLNESNKVKDEKRRKEKEQHAAEKAELELHRRSKNEGVISDKTKQAP